MAEINSSPSAEITHIPLTSVSQPQDSHITEIPLENHRTRPVRLNCCCKCINITLLYVCSKIFTFTAVFLLYLPIFILVGIIVPSVAVLLFPCLLVLFVFARFLQLIRHGEAYDNATLLKFCIRNWIFFVYAGSFIPVMLVFGIFCRQAPSLCEYLVINTRISGLLWLYFMFSRLCLFYLPRVQLDPLGSGINVPEAVIEIAECAIVIFCLYDQYIIPPALTYQEIYGFEIWKWTTSLLIIVSIYNCIRLVTHLFVRLLKKFFHDNLQNSNNGNSNSTPDNNDSILEIFLHRKSLMYWANGLKHYATFLLSSSVFLLAWVLYIGHQLNGTPKAKHFLVFGTRTCLSFITCALLWFIKSCILLSWEADSIYDRLESKILQGGKHLYFLGILGRHKYDIFNLLYDNQFPELRNRNPSFWTKLPNCIKYVIPLSFGVNMNLHYASLKHDTADEWISGKNLSKLKMKNAKEYLLINGTPTTFGIQQAVSYFLMAQNKLLEDKYTVVLHETLQCYNQDDNHEIRGGITEDILKQIIGEDTWSDFQLLLNENSLHSSEEISLQTKFTAWLDMAHKNCLVLANTLKSSRELVDCLNKIISVFIIFTSFLMWLLVTGLATTKVLVLIATPILGLSFIFQNTCKALFEGVMFAYVVNPFNVGDLCILDSTMMEVKAVGVWRTLFDKVATQEEIVYTNSELATKSIINHGTEFDWNDYLELDLGSLDKEKINYVKKEIEGYLGDNEDKFTVSYTSVEVMASGDNMSMKLAINYKHRVDVRINSYFECLKEKRRLRSEFVLHAEDIVNRKKNEGSSNSG